LYRHPSLKFEFDLAVAESQGSLSLHSELKIAIHRHRVPLVSERLGDPLHFPELVGFLDAVSDLLRIPRWLDSLSHHEL